jgi:hypothetical protein
MNSFLGLMGSFVLVEMNSDSCSLGDLTKDMDGFENRLVNPAESFIIENFYHSRMDQGS